VAVEQGEGGRNNVRGKIQTQTAAKRRTNVKSIRNLKLGMKVGFMALALCLAASQGKAQDTYKGQFTLPFEARWGLAVLPPGDYTISLDAANSYLVVRGEDKTAMIMGIVTDRKDISDHSQLTVVKTAAGYAVQTLEAGEAGLTLTYSVPKSKRDREAQELHAELTLPVSTVRE
jgi:hypothetical protein